MKKTLHNNPLFVRPVVLFSIILALAFGFILAQNISAEEPPIDTEAPSAPSNLVATNISTTGASLSWVESTDNVAVTGYEVYKDLSQLVLIAKARYSDLLIRYKGILVLTMKTA